MPDDTALQIVDTTTKLVDFTTDELQFIKNELVEGDITDMEFKYFIAQCMHTGANPILKEVYAYKFSGKNPKMAVVFAYTFLIRMVREKDPAFDGFTIPEYFDGEKWADVWIHTKTAPLACRIGLKRKGHDPAYAQCLWQEKVKTYDGKPLNKWKSDPVHMLTKCTQKQAVVNVYGSIIGTMPIQEEMPDPGEVTDADQWPNGTYHSEIEAKVSAEGIKEASQEIEKRIADTDTLKKGHLMPPEPTITVKEKEQLKGKLEQLGIPKGNLKAKLNEILVALKLEPVEKVSQLTISAWNSVMDALDAEIKDGGS